MPVEGGKITIEKVDLLRERCNISYRKALEILRLANGDVIEALVMLEEEPNTWTERVQIQGAELVSRVRELIKDGNVNRITIRNEERTLLDIPISVGAIGAVLMPYLTALGVIAAVASRCTIEVQRRSGGADEGPIGTYGGQENGPEVGYAGMGHKVEIVADEAEGPAGPTMDLDDGEGIPMGPKGRRRKM